MRTLSNLDYKVTRKNTARYWEEPRFSGDIISLDCAYCDFQIRKRSVAMPRKSKSGLGRYNRMRSYMIKHLHEEHRDEMLEAMNEEERKDYPRYLS